MEDIAAEAGAGKGTLYRYFRDKEKLYLELLTRSSEQFMQQMEEVAAAPGTARRRLEQLVAAIIGYFDSHPHLFDLIQRAEVLREPGVAFPWQKTRENLPRLVAGVCERGQAQGEFVIRDLDLNVLLLLGGLRSVLRFGPRPRPADLAERVVANFLEGAATG
jgi:AcrR family transcriptional regulator